MAGYVRNDTANNIAPDKEAQASDIDGEFDAIQAAFSAISGHNHDGTTAEGAPITVLGPAQDVEITSTAIQGATTNDIDLGSTTKKFKNVYVAGNYVTDGLVDGVDIATRDAALTSAQATITSHGNRLTTAEGNITSVQSVNNTQNTRLNNVESKNTTQDSTLSSLQTQINTLVTLHNDQQALINSLTTQLNASESDIIKKIYPVGSLYITARNENPATTLGAGMTWEAYGAGRALVGVGTADGVNYTVGQARGANEITLSTAHLPIHNHQVNPPNTAVTIAANGVNFSFDIHNMSPAPNMITSASGLTLSTSPGSTMRADRGGDTTNAQRVTYNAQHAHTGSVDIAAFTSGDAGSGDGHSNIQPSIGVFVWRRVS